MKTVEQLLREDHTRLDRLLTDLIDALNIRDPTLAFRKLDLFWALLAVHIRAEHLHLFPALLSVAGQTPRVTELIESLCEDHNFFMHELGIVIKTLRNKNEETGKEVLISVREIINGVAKRLAHHNEIEETEIYPLVSLVCNKTAERRITAGIGKELANIPQRFKRSSRITGLK